MVEPITHTAQILVTGAAHEVQQLCGMVQRDAHLLALGAPSTEAASQLLQDQEFDLVLLDLPPGDHDGLRLLRGIRQAVPDLPVIVLAAFGHVRSAVAAMKLGAAEYLVKPVDTDELLQNIHELLLAQRARRPAAATQELTHRLTQAHRLETVGRLTNATGHELNNLMTVIVGYGQFLLGQMAAEPIRPQLMEVEKAASQAGALMQQLLSFGRPQVPAPALQNLNSVVHDIVLLAKRLVGKHRLNLNLDSGLGLMFGDKGQLEQALMILVLNARDALAGKSEGGEVTISTFNSVRTVSLPNGVPQRPAGRYIALEVSDDGCGMTPPTRARLFEPYFSTKEPEQGSGLGLTIVKQVVIENHGAIDVVSEPGRGATFTLYFPEAKPELRTALDHSLPETILIVDDTESVRDLLRIYLRGQGYDVLEAADGDQALLMIRTHPGPIHLVLIDVMLPDMGGPDLLQKLLLLRPGMRAVFMSGYGSDILAERDDYPQDVPLLEKPISPAAVARKLREVLDSRNLSPVRSEMVR